MFPFNVFQTAYTVTDIDEAMHICGARMGIPEFRAFRNSEIQTGDGVANCHFAICYLGDTQLELIQPAGGADAVYRELLPATGKGMRLHHLGCLLNDEAQWEKLVAEIAASGRPTPVSGSYHGLMHYLYVDHRDTLGHYLEYMCATPAGAGMFADVPRYPRPPVV